MNNLLTKNKHWYKGLDDILYYKIFDKNTNTEAYVFSEYNEFFGNEKNKLIGKCFYLYSPNCDSELYSYFKSKVISGKRYINLGYKKDNDKLSINNDLNIKRIIEEKNMFTLFPSDNIFSDSYSCFSEESIIGVSEPRKALIHLYKKRDDIRKIVDNIVETFDVNIENLGITGSLALGSDETSDYDIVFYEKIGKLKRPPKVGQKILFEIKPIDKSQGKWYNIYALSIRRIRQRWRAT